MGGEALRAEAVTLHSETILREKFNFPILCDHVKEQKKFKMS